LWYKLFRLCGRRRRRSNILGLQIFLHFEQRPFRLQLLFTYYANVPPQYQIKCVCIIALPKNILSLLQMSMLVVLAAFLKQRIVFILKIFFKKSKV
jgi:hypothetical protein